MIATYELPSPGAYRRQWLELNRLARAQGKTLLAAVIEHIEGQGAKVLNCISEDFGKRWYVTVEHEGQLAFAGAPLQLAGE